MGTTEGEAKTVQGERLIAEYVRGIKEHKLWWKWTANPSERPCARHLAALLTVIIEDSSSADSVSFQAVTSFSLARRARGPKANNDVVLISEDEIKEGAARKEAAEGGGGTKAGGREKKNRGGGRGRGDKGGIDTIAGGGSAYPRNVGFSRVLDDLLPNFRFTVREKEKEMPSKPP